MAFLTALYGLSLVSVQGAYFALFVVFSKNNAFQHLNFEINDVTGFVLINLAPQNRS